MEKSIYDRLLQLPLFQGLSKNELTCIIDKVKLNFQKFPPNKNIIDQNSPCEQLTFLLSGELLSHTTNKQNNFTMTEVLTAPCVIEPYSLFGMRPYFTASYQTNTKVSLVCINKSYILDELCNYKTFHINYLNILSNRAQVCQEKNWINNPTTPEEKIVHFIRQHCNKPEGSKTLHIKMEDLANIIDETRNTVSKTLNDMENKQLIKLDRKTIQIPALEKL